MSRAVRDLPHIRFEAVAPAVGDALPRLDIAAFVGFATAGPFDVPVAIESSARYREIFGESPQLARDAVTGTRHHGALGRSVDAFFANGGVRCWVVRVGRNAPTREFRLAGLVATDTSTPGWAEATAAARSAGTFADRLRALPFEEVERLHLRAGHPMEFSQLATSQALGVGDFVRATTDSGNTIVYGVVGAVVGRVARIVDHHRFESRLPAPGPIDTWKLGADATPVTVHDIQPGPDNAVTIELPLTVGLSSGDVLVIRDSVGDRFVVPTTNPRIATATPSVPAMGVDGTGAPTLRWDVEQCHRHVDGGTLDVSSTPSAVLYDRVTAGLAVFDGERLLHHLTGLGLDARHPRFIGALPTDDELFATIANLANGDADTPMATGVLDREVDVPEGWRAADHPRFPLARRERGPSQVFPLALGRRIDPLLAHPAHPLDSVQTVVARNGAARFDESLFLDAELNDTSTSTLVTQAAAITHIDDRGRRLVGLHALFSVPEVSIVATPDAALPAWETRTEQPPYVPAAPVLTVAESDGGHRATWTSVSATATYELELSTQAAFDGAVRIYAGPDLTTDVLEPVACPALWYLRVRATDGATGPWSNTVAVVRPARDFDDCDALDQPIVVALDTTPASPDTVAVTWHPTFDAVEIEVSVEPDFGAAVTATALLAPYTIATPETTTYLRARRLGSGAAVDPWSNTVTIAAAPTTVAVTTTSDPFDAKLVAIHRGMLRFAAARGDLLAVLSLPHEARDEAVATHLAQLDPGLGPIPGEAIAPLGDTEAFALSYGAMYHPWIGTRRETTLDFAPPDGWVAGSIAQRTLTRGAWIAPANISFSQAVGLLPRFTADQHLDLTRLGVNVVCRNPTGFSADTANTLSETEALRPISTRRLMILLRRLVLRHGDTYVFEPHSARFRAMVRNQWQAILLELFQRGAFAGRRPRDAFLLTADGALNPQRSVDLGRFIVEMAVAPSRPLEFIRVRLLASDAGPVRVEEAVA